MKTILSLLLLPIMLLAQTRHPYQEHLTVEFSMDFDTESILRNGIAMSQSLNGAIELLITVEIYLEELEIEPTTPQFTHSQIVGNVLPRYLDTYYLIGFPPTATENRKPQERLDHLLALNDPQFPKEDTLQNWLRPARYQQNKWGGATNVPEGWGPRIRL